MPTEEFTEVQAVQWSPTRHSEYLSPTDLTSTLIRIKDILVELGWSVFAESHAQADVLVTYVPVASVPSPPPDVLPVLNVSNPFLVVDTIPFAGIDLGRYTQGLVTDHGRGMGYWFMILPTPEQTLDSLCDQITDFSSCDASWYFDPINGFFHVIITTKVGGATGNDLVLWTNPGLVSAGAIFAGGGYYLDSSSNGEATQYRIWIRKVRGSLNTKDAHHHALRVAVVNDDSIYDASSLVDSLLEQIHIIANPYQFILFRDSGTRPPGAEGIGSVLLSAPKIPDFLKSTITSCVWMLQEISSNELSFTSCGLRLNSTEMVLANTGSSSHPRFGQYEQNSGFVLSRYDGASVPLLSGDLKPIIQNAYVMLPNPNDSTKESKIVGQLWDTIGMSDTAAFGSEMLHETKKFKLICRSSGAEYRIRGSIWMATQ